MQGKSLATLFKWCFGKSNVIKDGSYRNREFLNNHQDEIRQIIHR